MLHKYQLMYLCIAGIMQDGLTLEFLAQSTGALSLSMLCKIIVESGLSAKSWMPDNLQDVTLKYSCLKIIGPIMIREDKLNEFVGFSMQTMSGCEDILVCHLSEFRASTQHQGLGDP